MSKNPIYTRTCVYNINYHVVWSVKYRRKVLSNEMEQFLVPILNAVASENGFSVSQFRIGDGNHVHCFITAPPKICISTIVKILKGVSAKKLFEQYPQLKQTLQKGVLWNHSYYVETVGCISEDAIRKYVEKQTNSY